MPSPTAKLRKHSPGCLPESLRVDHLNRLCSVVHIEQLYDSGDTDWGDMTHVYNPMADDIAEAVLFADHVSSIAAKDAEIAALRERCGRLRELFDATIDCQSDESTDKDWLRRDIAYAKCIKHNDLDEKEPTDG